MVRFNFVDAWHEEAESRGLALPENVSEVIGAYAGERWDPAEGLDFLEAIQSLRTSESGGRNRARGSIEEPAWWPFYFEQMVRGCWRDPAQEIRTALGLSGPIKGRLPEIASFVSGVLAEARMPQEGMRIELECFDADWPVERVHYTLYIGDIDRDKLEFYFMAPEHHKGRILDLIGESVVEQLGDSPYSGRYVALVFTALLGVFESLPATTMLGLSAAQVTQYILGDWMPDRPGWMSWQRTGGHYNTGVTLHIPSLVATPEQVRTLYVQARDAITATFPEKGCPVPQAVTEERMRAVRFIEENASRMAPLTWRKRWERARAEDVNLTWKDHDSLKAAYHAAVEPIRYLKTEREGGDTDGKP